MFEKYVLMCFALFIGGLGFVAGFLVGESHGAKTEMANLDIDLSGEPNEST